MSQSYHRSLPLLFIVSLAFAQEENPARKKLSEIDVLAGRWDVALEFRLTSQGPWESSMGRSLIRKTVDAALLEEDFTGTRRGHPFFAKSLFAVDNLTLKYQGVFVDSEHGALIEYEAEKHADSLVFDRTWTYPGGANVQLRVVYRFISHDEILVERMRKPENTSAWDVTGRMKYTRAKETK